MISRREGWLEGKWGNIENVKCHIEGVLSDLGSRLWCIRDLGEMLGVDRLWQVLPSGFTACREVAKETNNTVLCYQL